LALLGWFQTTRAFYNPTTREWTWAQKTIKKLKSGVAVVSMVFPRFLFFLAEKSRKKK
jgi:hypothetical protein